MKTTPPEATLSSSCELVAVLGLHGLLAQQVLAARERAEELVVQIVAVGQDDQRRVLHRRVRTILPGVEDHRQALAGALRVPDDADPLVALGRRRRDRAVDRLVDGVELVIAGQLLA